MSKSLWSILVLGFITIVIMVVMMMFSLSAFQRSPASNRAKFSNLIRENFSFPEVGAGVKEADGQIVLRVEFLSSLDSNLNDEVINDELERVAAFTQERYPDSDRRMITQLRVRRTEVRGSGCWSRTLERDMTVDRPFAPRRAIPVEPEDN
jgi:hypothetical protein